MGHAAAGLREDLRPGRVVVRVAVRRVVVLVRVEVAIRIGLVDAPHLADRAVGPFQRIGEDDVGPVRAEDALPFGRDVLRDAQADAVTARRADHRVGDAGVAGGRVEDDPALLEAAGAFALEDHPQCGAILDRAARVLPLGLGVQLHAGGHIAFEAAQAHERRVADQVDNRVVRGRRGSADLAFHK